MYNYPTGMYIFFFFQWKLDKANYAENQTPIRKLYSYFNTRRDKIRYDTFIANGHPIDSGAIESAHKYTVQTRLKQAGMDLWQKAA